MVAEDLERMASLVAVAHPSKPTEVRRAFLRAARAARSRSEVPVWADPEKFRRFLGQVPGVEVDTKVEETGSE